MVILAVDDDLRRLERTKEQLQSILPAETVVAESNALTAAKFAFNHPVDILVTAVEMARLDGLKLMEFARHTNPKAAVFLLVDADDDFNGGLWADEVDGVLYDPVTRERLAGALRQAQRKREANSAEEPRRCLGETALKNEKYGMDGKDDPAKLAGGYAFLLPDATVKLLKSRRLKNSPSVQSGHKKGA